MILPQALAVPATSLPGREGQGQWMLQEESRVYASVPPVHTYADRAILGDSAWSRGRPRYGFICDDANASGGDSRLVV
jgi:hypothetical protein